MNMDETYDCTHYQRHCKLICPECDRAYVCRLCHDSAETHNINRHAVSSVSCLSCGTRQPKAAECSHCGQLFGKYSCLVCSLYDDRELGQFHCEGCRICRVGGRENYTHCDTCRSCLPNHLAGKHQCIQDAGERQCPVCLEDIHSSRDTAHVPSCHHFLHSSCFEQLIKQKIFACPVCGKSMFEMTKQWEEIDQIVRETPMPPSYHGVCCQVNCKDCNKDSITLFHIDGLKCKLCGSYNTSRAAGSFLRKRKNTGSFAASPPLADPSASAAASGTTNDFNASKSSTPSASNLSPSPPSSSSSSTPVASNSSPAHSTLSMEGVSAAAASSSSSPLVASAMEVFASASSPSSPLTAAMEVVSAASSMSESFTLESEAGRSASQSSTSRGTPGAVTAQEEIHLYEPVSLEELEDDSSVPEEGGLAALIQGLVHGFHDIIGLEDVDDDDDDFSSFLSGDSTPPVVLSVQINGRDAGIDEAEASDWVTEDEADDEFDTANSDSERHS